LSAVVPMPSAISAALRLKFYTEEGNWDMVGQQHAGVLFARPAQVSGFEQSVSNATRAPICAARRYNWDFWTLLPEALHQVTIVMSDRGIPKSYRHMHGFGSHTYSFINAANERFWVKFHFRTQQGIENLSDAEAEAVVGKDRESNQRDLYERD
jgi:catalase